MTDLQERLAGYHVAIGAKLRSLLAGPPSYQRLYAMMAYHFGWLDEQLRPCAAADGGKRLRPLLCLLACESVGAPAEKALPGAIAVELLHNFSLVHDDIEDSSRVRRHRNTVWSVWGVPHGVNVGDGMFALAHHVLTEDISEPGTALKAARLLDRTSIELCEGQFLDLHYAGAERVRLAEYLTMIRRKTAAMFGCALEMGALLGGAHTATASRLGRFGRVLGEAFQMHDDILGTWGDPAATGKAASDIRDRKRALPAVLAWERVAEPDLAVLSGLYTQPDPLGDSDAEWVRDLFERLRVPGRARQLANETFDLADQLLDEALPPAHGSNALRQFVDQLAERYVSQAAHNGQAIGRFPV